MLNEIKQVGFIRCVIMNALNDVSLVNVRLILFNKPQKCCLQHILFDCDLDHTKQNLETNM